MNTKENFPINARAVLDIQANYCFLLTLPKFPCSEFNWKHKIALIAIKVSTTNACIVCFKYKLIISTIKLYIRFILPFALHAPSFSIIFSYDCHRCFFVLNELLRVSKWLCNEKFVFLVIDNKLVHSNITQNCPVFIQSRKMVHL